MRTAEDAASALNDLLDDLAEIDARLASIAEYIATNPRHVLGRARSLNRATAEMIGQALRHPLEPTIIDHAFQPGRATAAPRPMADA